MNGHHRLDGKTALVTGGSRGIGAATALRLAQEGADVALTYVQNAEAAREVAQKIGSTGRRGLALQADAADAAAMSRAVETAADRLGGLDILVNNAGLGVLAPIESLTMADVDRVLAVNVRGVFAASQTAAVRLRDGGRIVSLGTALSRYAGGPGGTLYAMSKSALIGFTKALARELGPRGITVNLVQAGPVDTDMNPGDGPFADPQRAATALGRFGSADDIAALIAYLAGDEAGYITGTDLTADGGHAA